MTAQTDDPFVTLGEALRGRPVVLPETDAFAPEPGDEVSPDVLRLPAPFPPRPKRSVSAMAAIHRLNRLSEVSVMYRAWIEREVTLGYVQTVLDLTDEETEILYRGRDSAMRIDRLGRVTYDEPTLLRAETAVVGD